MSYWKFGGGYSYRTPSSKKTGWSKTLSGVPASAKKKATGATKKKPKKSSPKTERGVKHMAKKKKTSRKGGMRLPGGIGLKAALFGAAGLLIGPRIIPIQSPGATKLATGMAMKAIGIGGGGALSAVGIMELIAQYGGGLVLGGFGGGGNGGGYDY